MQNLTYMIRKSNFEEITTIKNLIEKTGKANKLQKAQFINIALQQFFQKQENQIIEKLIQNTYDKQEKTKTSTKIHDSNIRKIKNIQKICEKKGIKITKTNIINIAVADFITEVYKNTNNELTDKENEQRIIEVLECYLLI